MVTSVRLAECIGRGYRWADFVLPNLMLETFIEVCSEYAN